MAQDLIRCPGCGVKMDLSTFAIRPEEVVCPRCSTRAAVPPLMPVVSVPSYGAVPSAPLPAAYGYGAQSAYPPYLGPAAYSAQVATAPTFAVPLQAQAAVQPLEDSYRWQQAQGVVPLPSMPLPTAVPQPSRQPASSQQAPASQPVSVPAPAPATRPVSAAQPAPTPASQPAPVPVARPAQASQPVSNPHPAPRPQQPTSQQRPARTEASTASDPFAESSFFRDSAAAAKSLGATPAILPIDKKGNTEPLAFAFIGLLSLLTFFPPIGIALCILALMMTFDERKRGLYNSHRGLTVFVAVVGLLASIVFLVVEIAFIVSLVMYPPEFLSYFL